MVGDVHQHLSAEQATVGLRATAAILKKWQATTVQACQILRISRRTLLRAQKVNHGSAVTLDPEQLQRLSLVLSMHSTLRTVFENPTNVYGYPAMANDNYFFNGRSPLEIMAQGDMISLYETARRINALSVA